MKYALPPPQHWQDFQEITEALAKKRYADDIVSSYGREGQDQEGIDIYVENRAIGIQAKNRRLFDAEGKLEPNGRLDIDEIKGIAGAAKAFKPALSRLVIATTALRDVSLQKEVFALNSDRKKDAEFQIEMWFWDEFQAHINNHNDLLDLHYRKILPRIPGFDPDAVLLATVSDAFHRPALVTPVRQENSGDDFLQALKDVQEALSTGVSHDRTSREVRSRAIYGFPQAKDAAVKQALEQAWACLNQVRNTFSAGLAMQTRFGPAIVQHNGFMEVRDRSLADQLNEGRKRAIEFVNRALAHKQCPPILERAW